MSRFQSLAVTLAVTLALTFANPTTTEGEARVDVTEPATQLVKDIRQMVVKAKSGISLAALRKDVLDLQTTASDLLNEFRGEVLNSEVQSTIKMASSGTGSHEMLTVLLADDTLGVLNGRLAVSLSFLERVAQLMEDELSLDGNVGPHLSAIVFGTNVTLGIVDTADKKVLAMTTQTTGDKDVSSKGSVRRQLKTQVDLGRGWSVGLKGVQWQSRNGRYTFNARPTFSGFRPNGFGASFTMRF